MTAWKPGDPVGFISPGVCTLPDAATAALYAAECRRQMMEASAAESRRKIIEARAGKILAARSVEQRRQMIELSPEEIREDVKAEVLRQWNARNVAK